MIDNLRVVVAAAGKSSRMGGNTSKQYMLLNGRPVLAYSLDFFEKLAAVSQIVVVCAPYEVEYCQEEVVKRYQYKKVMAVVPGGQERQDSVWAGLQQLGADTDLVAVHDGARPLLSLDMVARLLAEAREWGAAIPGIPSRDTVKLGDRDGFVRQTLDRTSVYAIQTPQVFNYAELRAAYQEAREEDFLGTDDSTLFERYIGRVKIVSGDFSNIKITTPEDMIVAAALLKR